MGYPMGYGESAYMSHEKPHAGSTYQGVSQASRTQVMFERDISTARARGADVSAAIHAEWLSNIALRKGNRPEAMREFARAERDLDNRELSHYSCQNNRLRAKGMTEALNAADMHPNTSATTAY
jgi:hypothetical protein